MTGRITELNNKLRSLRPLNSGEIKRLREEFIIATLIIPMP